MIFLVSCEGNVNIVADDAISDQPIGITFKGAITSRATDTAFEVGDEISITAYNQDGSRYAQNISYTYASNLFTSSNPIKYSSDDQELSFRAVYPYVEIPEDKIVNFTIKSNQSIDNGYTLSDLMLSYVAATTNDSPELIFDHLMTKIVINITSIDVEVVNVVASLNAMAEVEYNLSTLNSSAVGSTQSITMVSDAVNSYKAILVPQKVAANTIFGTIAVGDLSYEISFSQDVDLLGGKQYSIDATIFDGEIIFDSPIINEWEEGEFPEVIDERTALVALYNATGGDDWFNNTNWCSDAPLSEWYGVTVNEAGQVTELFLKYNGLSGEIGDVLQPLTALESIEFSASRYYWKINSSATESIAENSGKENSITGSIDLSKSINLQSVVLDNNELDSVLGVENLAKLETLSLFCTYVEVIDVSACYNLTFLNASGVNVPTLDISKLTNLDSFGVECYVTINTEVIFGDNSKLTYLFIGNVKEVMSLDVLQMPNLTDILITNVDNTDLYVDISRCTKLVNISIYSCDAEVSLNTDLSQCPDLVKFCVMDCNILNSHLAFPSTTTERVIADNCGIESVDVVNLINLKDITVSNNKLTSLVLPSSTALYWVECENNEIEGDFSEVFAQMVRSDYSKSSFILRCDNNNITGNIPSSSPLSSRNLLWFSCTYNKMSGTIPEEIVMNSTFKETYINPQKDGYGLIVPDLNYYDSEDYSQDGVVMTLQTASEGTGINLVFVGDGFADTQMGTDGEYETRMKQAMEAFFDEEPLKTFRDRYNVYAVKAVSQNEGIGDGRNTVFSSIITDGSTLISGDDTSVFEYALKVPAIMNTDNLTAICILNSYTYAGTCYMYYGNNAAVAYCPIVNNSDTDFKNIVLHEGAGHGFGKLADEYYYTGTITSSAISMYEYEKSLGWMKNVDITDDPDLINWSHMISDPVYTNYVDIIQGAYTYQYGAYRPSNYSIMHYNTGGFNAPSREAIYKWIMEFSGDTYSFEKFKEYDQINLTQTAFAARAAQVNSVDISTFKPTSPPVIIDGKPKAQKQ